MWIRTYVVGMLLLGNPSTAVAQGDVVDVVTPFALSDRGGIIVDVTLDGRGPFRLLLDTGSTHTIITEPVALAVGARAVASAVVTSAAGAQMLPVVAIERLAIGPVAMRVLPTVVPSLPVEGEADGLLGQDVLGGRRYTLDNGRKVVVWHQDRSPTVDSAAVVLPMEEVQGRFVVKATVDARPVRLVIDTGSEALVLFGWSRHPGAVRTVVSTVSGSEEASVGRVGLRLGVGDRTSMVAVHVSRDVMPGQPEGLLPLHRFGQVTVDGPGRRLVISGTR